MKTNRILLLILGLILAPLCKSQNNFWTVPDEFFIPDFGTGSLPTFDYLGSNSTSTHAGIVDPYGNIVFFLVDGVVYDKNGGDRGQLYNSTAYPILGSSEALIVPQPGSCERYFIFTSGNESFGGQENEKPYVVLYDHGQHSLLEDGNGQTAFDLVDDYGLIEDMSSPDHGVKGLHFAATKERRDSSRWVYVSSNSDVYRIELQCEGVLTSTGWKHTINTSSSFNNENGWRSELELYEDTADNYIRIAAPVQTGSGPDGIKVAIFDVDSMSGNVIPGSSFQISVDPTSLGYVHGLEFTPDGKGLYIMHETSTAKPSPLSFYNFTTSTITNLNYTNISNFKNSQMQVAGDSANYTLYMASDNALGSLYDPDVPSPPTSNWTPNAIPLNTYSSNYAGIPTTSFPDKKHIVPDQIDYDNYVEDWFFASCDCCNKYAYAGKHRDTLYTVVYDSGNTSLFWNPGPGGNPWNALASDTIFIRDSLVIEAGMHVTIRNMNFKFGKDAEVILKRGDILAGAVLTMMDSTLFSADFRCFERDYVCDDPDSCKVELWNGVRVEGRSGSTQSLTAFTKQARLNMEGGSMIEFADVGIRAGHPTKLNYGGGILRVTGADLKDCPTGIRFESYNSGGMTLSRIRNSNLFWTAALPENHKPKRLIEAISISGVLSEGNVFSNDDWQNYIVSERGTGIYAANSRIIDRWYCSGIVIPCTPNGTVKSQFNNLRKGIDAIVGSSNRTIEALRGVYTNTYTGILLNGLNFPVLLDNEFYIPNADNAAGIALLSCDGYSVEGNYFTSMTSSPIKWNYGVSVSSSGPNNNEIYRNHFEMITLGIVSAEQNADCPLNIEGLTWKCNVFDQRIYYADIHVYTGNVSIFQGSCLPNIPTNPAGNFFSHSSSTLPNHYDINVRLIAQPYQNCNSLQINYRYHWPLTQSTYRLEPIKYTNQIFGDPNHVLLDPCSNTPWDDDACRVKRTSLDFLPSFPGGKSCALDEQPDIEYIMMYADSLYAAIDNMQGSFDDAQSGLMQSSVIDVAAGTSIIDELLSAKEAESNFWKDLITLHHRDSLGLLSEDFIWSLIEAHQPGIMNRYAAAYSIEHNSSLPTWIPYDFTQEAFTVNTSEFNPEFYYATGSFDDYNFSSAINDAFVSQGESFEKRLFDFPYPGVDLESEKSNTNETGSLKAEADIVLFPNPFNDELNVLVKDFLSFDEIRIVIYDVVGRLVYDRRMGSSAQFSVDTKSLPVGLLIYSVYGDGSIIQNGKLIKTK